jgi:hypothetical protein
LNFVLNAKIACNILSMRQFVLTSALILAHTPSADESHF